MGIFDPKVDVQFTPESIPQPEQNGALLGIAQAVGTVADGFFSTRKSGRSGGTGKNTEDWAPIHAELDTIRQYRKQGAHAQAKQLEVNLTRQMREAEIDTTGGEYAAAYESIVGRPFEQSGETPESFQMKQAMANTEKWATAWSATFAMAGGKDPNLTQAEREAMTMDYYMGRERQAVTGELAAYEWNRGGSDQAKAGLQQDLLPFVGVLEQAQQQGKIISLGDLVMAERSVTSVFNSYSTALDAAGVPVEAREEFFRPLKRLQNDIDFGMKLASYEGEKGIHARLMSDFALTLDEYPSALQIVLGNAVNSENSFIEVMAILQTRAADGDADAMRGVQQITDAAANLFFEPKDLEGYIPDLNAVPGETLFGAASRKLNSADAVIDRWGVAKTELGTEWAGVSIDKLNQKILSMADLLQSGNLPAEDMDMQRNLYVVMGSMLAGTTVNDGGYFNANDVGKIYNGTTEAGVRELGNANPQFGWEAASANTLGLIMHGDAARIDIGKQLAESIFKPTTGPDGSMDYEIDRDLLASRWKGLGISADNVNEAMQWMDKQPGGIEAALRDQSIQTGAFGQGKAPRSVSSAIGLLQTNLNLNQTEGRLKDSINALTMIDDRTDAFRKLTTEFGTKIGKVVDEDGFEVTTPTSGTPNTIAGSVVEAGKGYTTIAMKDGSVVRREGTRAWRNNNPGNIEFGEFAKKHGAVGTDGRFAVFPTYEDGRNAKMSLLFETSSYKNLSITDAINRYAPPFENNTSRYTSTVAQAAGVPMSTRMSDLTDVQRELVLDAMERVEGFKPGTETTEDGVTTQAGSPNTPSEVTSQPIAEDVAGDTMDAITETANADAPTSSPTPEGRPDASVIPPEMQRLFEEGGSGFTGEQAREALEKNKFLDESIRTLSASQVEGIIRALVAG